MAGYDLPLRAIRQQVSSALDLDRPDRAARGRLAPRHLDHRGAADGVRRDHAAGALQVPDRRGHRRRHDRRRPRSTGLRPTFLAKFEKRGITLPLGPLPDARSAARSASERVRVSEASRSPGSSLGAPRGGIARRRRRARPAASCARPRRRARRSRTASFVLSLPTSRRSQRRDVTVTENGNPVADVSLLSAARARASSAFGVVLVIDASESMAGKPIAERDRGRPRVRARREPEPAARARHVQRQASNVALPFTTDHDEDPARRSRRCRRSRTGRRSTTPSRPGRGAPDARRTSSPARSSCSRTAPTPAASHQPATVGEGRATATASRSSRSG